MLALAMFLGVAGQVGVLNPFQGLFLRMTGPVESLTLGIFEPVATVLSGAGELDELQDQNDRLRIENEELRNRIAQLEQDTDRLEELEQALGVSQEDASERLAANVLTRDLSAFSAVVRIDKGSNHGISTGMVVVSAQGTLLGTITKALDDTSFVRLATDTQSRVNARAVESSALGVVKGTTNRGLSFDLGQGDLKVGDIIVTSGLGGNYPEGIVIGRVSEVSGNSQDLFQKVTVEPGVRGSTAQTVFVRTDFVPQRLEVGE